MSLKGLTIFVFTWVSPPPAQGHIKAHSSEILLLACVAPVRRYHSLLSYGVGNLESISWVHLGQIVFTLEDALLAHLQIFLSQGSVEYDQGKHAPIKRGRSTYSRGYP